MTGRITRTSGINPAWEIEIDGYPSIRFMDYTRAEAIRRYKHMIGLSKNRARLREYVEQDNLSDAVMAYLRSKTDE